MSWPRRNMYVLLFTGYLDHLIDIHLENWIPRV